MSDNVLQFPSGAPRKKPSKKKPDAPKKSIFPVIWRLVGLVLLVLVVVALYLFRDSLNFDQLSRNMASISAKAEDHYGAHTFGTHSTNRYALYDGGLAVATVSGLELYDESSDLSEKIGSTMSNPAINLGDKMVLAYDIGGSNLAVADDGMAEVLVLATDGQILDADLSTKDSLVYAVASSGNKTVVTVCNDKMVELYKWYSATRYMPLCTINADGSWLATTALGQESGSFQTQLCLFDTTVAEVQTTVDLGNQTFFDLEFLNDRQIVAIGENSAVFLNERGELVGTYDYAGNTLDQYTYWENGEVTLALKTYVDGNSNHLVTLDGDGNVLEETTVDGVVVNISTAGNYLAVLTTERLIILRNDLSLYGAKDNVIGTTVALAQSNGACILIGGGSAQWFLP